DQTWHQKLKIGFDALYEKAFSFGGLVSGEHGIGYAKREYMQKLLGDKQLQIMRGIKASFDPHHILNPGKVI
ncbi:MAG: FAD-linked oxidase C-terminal domain-containing protein, partial [Acholeplasmataceae bacterium]|nr:FAD-linked oxidase C-terminal domain-containing protein [Acholeplasmataceae bacterium]